MDSLTSDSHLQFISPPDIESHGRSSRVFSSAENNRESVVSRSRLLSRMSYHHYTQSIYSELSRARDMPYGQEELKVENASIPALDKIDSVKMIRNLKKGTNNDLEVLVYLEDAVSNSREYFKSFSWKFASGNALFFSYEPNNEKTIVHHKPATTDSNFLYMLKEDTPDINSLDVYFESKNDEEKLGNVGRYGGQDAEDVVVTDTNGALLYKIVEDLKPNCDDFSCIVLDLLGNKVGSGEINFLEAANLSCQVNFPQETTSKQKVLILTAFLFKVIQLGIGVNWNSANKTIANSIMASDNCLLCFLKGK